MKREAIYYDELTGVHNRRFLHYWVDNEIKRANRFATKFGMILIDLDNFRDINNNYGHLEGDRVLIEFALFLKNSIREVDNLVRYGGDEFIILVPNTDMHGLTDLAQRILTNLNKTRITNHKISCSIGCAVYPDDGMTMDLLINQADRLMYQAKKEGKNRIGIKTEITKKIEIPAKALVGREEEVRVCAERLKEYHTLLIAGEAGVGKTRLAVDLKNIYPESIFLRANAYAALSSVPYHPFRNMLRDIVNQNFVLIQRVFRQLPEICRQEIMKLLPEEKQEAASIEGLDKYRLFESIKLFFHKIGEIYAPAMVVVLVDDLHWIDRSSSELMDFLIRSSHNQTKIIGTYRSEEIRNSTINDFLSIWARENLYTKIDLAPLDYAQTFKLLEIVMGQVTEKTAKFIYGLSGGNPFYTEEILRELEGQNKILFNGKEWVLLVDKELKVPSSIEATILRKIQFLDVETKEILDICAIYGQEFDAEIIALCAQQNVGKVLDHIDRLFKLGFVKERGPDLFFFSEDIVRQIVYRNIDRANLLKYHKQVGNAIEKYFAGSLPNYYEQLAYHFIIANDAAKALCYSKLAGAKCKENYAHQQAVEFLTNALKYEDNIEEIYKLKYSLAEIFLLMGNTEKAITNLNVCKEMHPGDERIYSKLGQIYENIAEYKKALDIYSYGLEITEDSESSYQFRAGIAWIYARMGDYLKTKRECETILRDAKKVPAKELGSINITLGVAYLNLGDIERAVLYFKKALELREKLNDKRGMAACYLDMAVAYQQQLKFSLSETCYNNALKLYEDIGYQAGISITLLDLGSLYYHFSLLKSEEYYLKSLTIAKLIGLKRDMVYLYNNLAMINLRRMMIDDAINNFKVGMQYARETNFTEGVIFINTYMSEYFREIGKRKQGLGCLNKALSLARKIKISQYLYDCQFEQIEYLILAKQFKKANQLSKSLLAKLKSHPDISRKVYAYIYQAKVASAMGSYEKANRYCDSALNIIVGLPDNYFTADICFLKGVNYKKQGKYQDAMQMFLRANEIYMKLGNLLYLDRIEHEIASVDISKRN